MARHGAFSSSANTPPLPPRPLVAIISIVMKRLLIPAIALIITPICCSIYVTTPWDNSESGSPILSSILGLEPPAERAVEPSQEALDSFNEEWQSVILAPPGDFTMTFSEAELTSAFWDSIIQLEAQSGEDIPVSDIQVLLQDNTMYVYATVDAGIVQSSGLITAQPSIGPNGNIDVAILSADFGLVQLDQADIIALEAEVENTLNQWALEAGTTVTGVAIGDGQFTITGSTAP